ncbi:PREDICTED: tensin [Drosophila arizonae]|uniref:Tensin n=1 Tax=Drosophila arizonae TaxID=7263 RepID=A0ABM1P509_DROAR|nr:PREDICTED: tensin [Drosophila arizonae]XP_017862296.1 PREDICTED: tensin [Drosophila arizonae]
MQDIRLRLEPQHNTAAFTNSPAEATSSAATLVNAEAALIETGERKGSAEGSPLVQLLPELSFSAPTANSTVHYYQHQHQHQPHSHQHPHQHSHSRSHSHSHSHPVQPRATPRHQVEELQLLHSHHTAHSPHNGQELGEQQMPRSPSSEEDNSPTEMNNCRRLVDKPPLVKRLTMGIGLLRGTEDSRPLVHNTCSSSLNSGSSQTISDGYVNEAICEPDKYVASKFGDSCRQSLTALETATQRLQSELPNSKKYLRETSSANSSPKLFAASSPLRLDNLSLAEQQELKGAAWYQAGIPREISLEVLSRQSPGAFLVRQSSTKPGCFALSLRVPPPAPRVAHYLILRTQRGYKIKGFTKEFSSLRALITHHSVMPELLPVPLTLPRPPHIRAHAQTYGHGSGNGNGAGGDFDMYGSLNDFRKMMADLNV